MVLFLEPKHGKVANNLSSRAVLSLFLLKLLSILLSSKSLFSLKNVEGFEVCLKYLRRWCRRDRFPWKLQFSEKRSGQATRLPRIIYLFHRTLQKMSAKTACLVTKGRGQRRQAPRGT